MEKRQWQIKTPRQPQEPKPSTTDGGQTETRDLPINQPVVTLPGAEKPAQPPTHGGN